LSINRIIQFLKEIRRRYIAGTSYRTNPYIQDGWAQEQAELKKRPRRTEIINYLLDSLNRETEYLEIGVRNPGDNFNHIRATRKYSVDPGLEYDNPEIDFKLTSDEFFAKLRSEALSGAPSKFDVVFIDGLHLADQAFRDIVNSLDFLKDDGFVVMHDCNPPSEFYARETYGFHLSPAGHVWNGTTWKAYCKARLELQVKAHCIDSDWGVGILQISAEKKSFPNLNPFYEFHVLAQHRRELLNLVSFEEFKQQLLSLHR